MAIEREIDDTRSIRDAGASEKKEERISLLLARGRSRGLLFHEDFKDRAEVIRAKAKSRHLARRGR